MERKIDNTNDETTDKKLIISDVIGSVFFVVGWDGEQESRYFCGKTKEDCELYISKEYTGIYYSKDELSIDEVEIKHYR